MGDFVPALIALLLNEHAGANLIAAAGVCAVSAYLAFYSLWMARDGARANRIVWSALSLIALGVGVWSTHFLAMLGFRPDAALGFRADLTALSGLTALVGVGGTMALAVLARSWTADMLGGAVVALSALAMHTMGVVALSNCIVTLDAGPTVAAFGGAAVAFAMALRLMRRERGRNVLKAALVFSAGLLWLHFVALGGARIDLLGAPEIGGLMRREIEPLVMLGAVTMIFLTLAAMRMQRLGERQRDMMAAVANAMTDGAAMLDRQGQVLWVNPALRRRLGSAHPDTAATLAAAIAARRDGGMDGAVIEGLRADVERCLRDGAPLDVEIAADDPSGGEAVLSLRLTPARDDAGRAIGHVLSVRDVTAERRREERLAAERDAAEAMSGAKSQLMAVASHELRTPLNGVLGLADLLRRHVTGPPGEKMLAQLAGSAQRLNSLLGDILEFADGPTSGSRESCRPEAIAAALRRKHEPAAAARGLDFSVDIDPDVGPAIICDAKALIGALGRLIDNAILYTPSGAVAVTLARGGWNDSSALVCTVADTGPGMTEEAVMVAIDGFNQVDGSSSRRHGGLGLGLALTRRAVAAMRGVMRFERTSQGCSFSIVLPGATETGAHAAPMRDAG